MKNFMFVAVISLFLLAVPTVQAQFKTQLEREASAADGFVQPSVPSFLFGWFDPEKFHMRHSFDFSYMTFGGQGLSLGTYTNSMTYQFSDKLNAQADVSLSYSPFSSGLSPLKKNDLSSVYLSRAQVDYKPWDNVLVRLQYRQMPYGSYNYYSPFYSPWYRDDER